MLTAHQISKSYNIQPVLESVSFSLNPGDRAGLIGPNGSGKTTLLRILAGLEPPDEGVVTCHPASIRTGYLAQGFDPDPGLSLGEAVRQVTGDLEQAEAEVARLASQLAIEPTREDLQAAYHAALLRLESASQSEIHPSSILEAFGLDRFPEAQPLAALSGGQKTRLALALVLAGKPDLLLLDEPTNHLDIQMLEWMEDWLVSFRGAALVVSHDRTFLDRTVDRILDLDPATHTLREYTGNYSDYLEQYLAERERQESAFRDQVAEVRRMRQDIARTKQQSLRVELTTTSRQPTVRRYAKKVARKAKSREKKLERFLESDERVEKPGQGWQMKLDFTAPSHLSKDVLALEDLSIGYPGNPPLARNLQLQVQAGARIALTGPNGGGKTTLLRTIAGLLAPLEGRARLGASVRVGYMAQEQEGIKPEWTALEIIQQHAPLNETEARSFLHFFLFSGDDALRPAGLLSYGERARLSLASLVVQGCSFLLLDEPVNHLDIPSRVRFEQALAQFDGTVLAVVHDRYFIERFATQVWVLDGEGLRVMD
jgi:ATP-binding cassette, subfamily F, member 3